MTCIARKYEEKPDYEEGNFSITCALFGHDLEYIDDYPYYTIFCCRCRKTGRTDNRVISGSKHEMKKLLRHRKCTYNQNNPKESIN